MTNRELIKVIYLRISKFKLLIILGGIVGAVLLYLYSKTIDKVYTAHATVFPLNSTPDNSAATSALSSMLGLAETPKSFTQDASINIIELAQSRNTREAVAMQRLPQFGNNTIAKLLIDDYNKWRGLDPEIKMPADSNALAALGGNLLKPNLAAKINKNGILEINYSAKDPKLVSPITYQFIDKISEFYKELKIKKAQLDYDFTLNKIDSLDKVLDAFDKRAVHMNNTTLFTGPDKLEYQIPKENLVNEKDRVSRQRDASANNREEALWRLQKVTPIIATLDKPDPPFEVTQPSAILFAAIGFIAGAILVTGLFLIDIFYKFGREEAKKAIFGEPETAETHTSTTA